MSQMGEIHDFMAYRARHLPERVSRQVARMRQDLIDHQNHLSVVDGRLEECTDTLKSMNLELQRHRQVCEKSQAINEQCEQALMQDDIDQLVELRNKLAITLKA